MCPLSPLESEVLAIAFDHAVSTKLSELQGIIAAEEGIEEEDAVLIVLQGHDGQILSDSDGRLLEMGVFNECSVTAVR